MVQPDLVNLKLLADSDLERRKDVTQIMEENVGHTEASIADVAQH